MKKLIKYLIMILLIIIAVSCFDENDFTIPDAFNWVGFTTNSEGVAEDSGLGVSAEIIVSAAKLSSDLNITYSVNSDEAIEGVDYSLPAGSGTITIPKGSNSVVVPLIQSALNNANVTGDRTVVFEITNAGGLQLGGPDGLYENTFSVIIGEDDFTVFGYTSFEDVDLTGLSAFFSKPGANPIENVAGKAPVDFTATGNELGFNTSYVPGMEGDPATEIMGVNNGAQEGSFGPYQYPFGNQGYGAWDIDGQIEIEFDEVTIPPGATFLRLDIEAYFNDGHDWEEENNGIELIWRTVDGDESVINVRSPGGLDDIVLDMDGNPIALNTWLHFKGKVNNVKTGKPVLRFENDNDADLIMVDMIIVQGF